MKQVKGKRTCYKWICLNRKSLKQKTKSKAFFKLINGKRNGEKDKSRWCLLKDTDL